MSRRSSRFWKLGWLGMILLSGLHGLMAEAEETPMYHIASSPVGQERPVPEQIQKQRQDPTWMMPLLSAQWCATKKAIGLLKTYKQHLLQKRPHNRLWFIALHDTQDDLEEYKTKLVELNQHIQTFGQKPMSCQEKVLQKLWHCLPSIRDMQLKAVGLPYGEPWCDEEPYMTYEELETGIEDPLRRREEKLNMHEVAETVQKELSQKKIQAQISGRVTANGQTLTIILKPEMENHPEVSAKNIANEYGSILRKAQYTRVIVIEGSSITSVRDL